MPKGKKSNEIVKENKEKEKEQKTIRRTTNKKQQMLFAPLKAKICTIKDIQLQTRSMIVAHRQQATLKQIFTSILYQKRCSFKQQKNLTRSMSKLHINNAPAADKSSLN